MASRFFISDGHIVSNASDEIVYQEDSCCCLLCDRLRECLDVDGATKDLEVVVAGVTDQVCADCDTALNTTYLFSTNEFVEDLFNGLPRCVSDREIASAATACTLTWGAAMSVGYNKSDPRLRLFFQLFRTSNNLSWQILANTTADINAYMDDLCNGVPIVIPDASDTSTQCSNAGSTATLTVI
jgi:hypothetical protein